MSNLKQKEKYYIVINYLNQIDPSFRFISFPIIDPKTYNSQLRINHVKTLPTLTFYKAMEKELNTVIEKPFTSSQELKQIAWRLINNLKQEREIMEYNQKLRQVQIEAQRDLKRIFLKVKEITQNIEKNLNLEKKADFIDNLFKNIKQINLIIGEAQLIYQSLLQIEIQTSIDLTHYIGLFSDQQNSKLLIAFGYDENAIEMIEFLDHVIDVLEDCYQKCEQASEEQAASKSAFLALQMEQTFSEGKEYFQVTNSLYHQLCAYIYLEFHRMIKYTREELKKLEPYLAKINKNICEILYLHFIKKRETEKIKDEFQGLVNRIKVGVREPLRSKENENLVKSIENESNRLLDELRSCKETYNLYTAECFTVFFEHKKMRRKKEIKQLKNDIRLFQQTLKFIKEIIDSEEPLDKNMKDSQIFTKLIEETKTKFEKIQQNKTRSKLPHQNEEINKIRNEAKKIYLQSEDQIVQLQQYINKFEQYYNVSYVSIFEHLFEKKYIQLKKTRENLYQIQDDIIDMLSQESKILRIDCEQIRDETDLLLKDIFVFLDSIDAKLLTRTDNKYLLDDIGTNILKLLMRLKKNQAQIEINLQDESLIISYELSSELKKMGQSLSIQLTNLEALGIIIESRSYFNSQLIVNTVYEFMDNQPEFKVLDSMLKDLPSHKKDVEEFITEYQQKVSSQLLMLSRARIELEQFFQKNFGDMMECHKVILTQHDEYIKKYNDNVVLLDSNFLNVITPIVTSYQKISNIIIDIMSNQIFQADLKNKIRDLLNKYLNKLKQNYVTDNLINIQRTCHVLIFYNKTKEEIIQKYHQIVRNSMDFSMSTLNQVLQNMSVPPDEFMSLTKDMRWANVFYKTNGNLLKFVNVSDYNSLLEKTQPLYDFFYQLQSYIKTLEQQYNQAIVKSGKFPSDREEEEDDDDNNDNDNDDEQEEEKRQTNLQQNQQKQMEGIQPKHEKLKNVVQKIIEQLQDNYKFHFDGDSQKMAMVLIKLLQTIFYPILQEK
ncbi:hypothetical protein ABPG72_021113 [Tetrahymena utriculariae]